ncbi:MAG: hypothetical protein CMJ46_01000 [Planctomyces sp.]|nr:hypothetical protein [Planctomyces sp.]
MIQSDTRTDTREKQYAPASERSQTHDDPERRSMSDLFKELRDESSLLLRQEVSLAKAEMAEKTAKFSRNIGYLIAGAGVAITSVLFFAMAGTVGLYNGLVAAGLSHATSGWLAPLIIGLVISIIGYAMIQKGISTLRRASLLPEQTVDSMKQNKEWIKQKVKS